MHHHNHHDGQAHILARYCGLDDEFPPRIRGYLQDGWSAGSGWDPDHEFFDGAWCYVWSDGPRRRARTLGRRNCHVVGAPFLYLMDLEPDLGSVAEEERRGTLWFPFHGDTKTHRHLARLIDEIKETETEPVTISLHHPAYGRPELRRAYEKAGFEVICFGKRGCGYEDTDRRFLYRQLEAFRRHRRVAANRLATAVFYGVAAGCRPAVYGDPMDPVFAGQARIARLWPEMLGKDIGLESARAVTDEELGRAWLIPPAEMRMLFDWNHRG